MNPRASHFAMPLMIEPFLAGFSEVTASTSGPHDRMRGTLRRIQNVITIETPAVFKPLEQPSRYKAAYGGRGSGKSWMFASMVVEHCLLHPGSRIVCIREIQRTLAQSAKALIEAKIQGFGVGHEFRVLFDRIETPGNGLISFIGMQDQNAERVKSLEGYDIAWVEEAQTLSARSLAMLRPTIRKQGSELWFTWNPRRRSDPVDEFFREAPENAIIVKANFNDNPFFPEVLDEERKLDFERYPDRYEHIWLGDYAKAFEGAYYAQVLAQARRDGRIGDVTTDPILPIKLFWDIGGAGAKADACAIWAVQFAERRSESSITSKVRVRFWVTTPTSIIADMRRPLVIFPMTA